MYHYTVYVYYIGECMALWSEPSVIIKMFATMQSVNIYTVVTLYLYPSAWADQKSRHGG